MGLIAFVLLFALVGFVVYLVTTFIPMPEAFKRAIIVVVIVALVLYLMRVLGVADIPIGRG